jgi:hypothetical protein
MTGPVKVACVGELERQLTIALQSLRQAERLATTADFLRAAGWLDALQAQVSDLLQGLPHALTDTLKDVHPS